MDVFCVRTQISLIMILNVQRWIICAYEQVSHRDTDVFCVRMQIFLKMILSVQRWIICTYEQIAHRGMSVICVRTQVFIVMALVFQCWVICAYNQVQVIRNFCARTQKTSKSLLRVCVYVSKIIVRNFCACTQKSSTSLLRICVYAQKIQQMIIIKSSNNPMVDVLRPAQKLQIWNTYIPVYLHFPSKLLMSF